jgi:hypothetical protein
MTTTASRIPSQAEYEARELEIATRRATEIERAPLADRKEAKAAFFQAMKNPTLIAERIGWMFDGNYGKGVQMQAQRILAGGKRSNKAAWVTQLVAVHEWQCPARMAADAWHVLSAKEKKALGAAVDAEIAKAERELAEEQSQ